MATMTRLGDETLFTIETLLVARTSSGPGRRISGEVPHQFRNSRSVPSPTTFAEPIALARHCRCMAKPREKTDQREKPEPMPAAGPHAKPELTDPDKTPGAGTLPPADKRQDDGSTTG